MYVSMYNSRHIAAGSGTSEMLSYVRYIARNGVCIQYRACMNMGCSYSVRDTSCIVFSGRRMSVSTVEFQVCTIHAYSTRMRVYISSPATHVYDVCVRVLCVCVCVYV